jgi:RNA polymerase sigma-70 factor (family 1)
MTDQSHHPSQRPAKPKEEVGNKLDLANLYTELRTGLMGFASRYFSRHQEIEDVVQDAFVKVIEAQQQRTVHSPQSYLYRTTRNLALNELDKISYKLTDTIGDLMPDSVFVQTPTMEEQFESRQRLELFCRAVQQLPAKCRQVYILRRIYGLSHKEIAERMDIGLKTVETHLTKAIMRSSDYMKAEEAAVTTGLDTGRKKHVK